MDRFSTLLSSFALVALLAGAPHAKAEEFSGKGTVTYVPVDSETIELPDSSLLRRAHMKGVILADDTKVPFHLATQDCAGSETLSPEGVAEAGRGYCDTVDADGDVWWMWWDNDPKPGAWGILGGTGKYEGMTGGGTTKALSQHSDGRLVLSWEGKWKMK